MPDKSRRDRGKHSARNKKRRGTPTRVAPERVAAKANEPGIPATPVSSPSVPTPQVALAGTRYPYVVTELRRIGILSGIMLTILIILSLVLP